MGFFPTSLLHLETVSPARLPVPARLTHRCTRSAPALTPGNQQTSPKRDQGLGKPGPRTIAASPVLLSRGEAPANVPRHPDHSNAAAPAMPQERDPLPPRTPARCSVLLLHFSYFIVYNHHRELMPPKSFPALTTSTPRRWLASAPRGLRQQPPPHASHRRSLPSRHRHWTRMTLQFLSRPFPLRMPLPAARSIPIIFAPTQGVCAGR